MKRLSCPLVGAAFLGLACPAFPAQVTDDAPAMGRNGQPENGLDESPWKRASDLLGMDVHTRTGEDVGELEEFVLHIRTGRIIFGVVSVGAFLDLGDALRVVRWHKLHLKSDGDGLAVDLTEKQIEMAPEFEHGRWPVMHGEESIGEGQELEEDHSQRSGRDEQADRDGKVVGQEDDREQQKIRFARASELVEMSIINQRGEPLGEVEDLFIIFDEGRVALVVVEPDESLRADGKLFVAPMQRFALGSSGEKHALIIDLDADQFKKLHGFDRNEWPDLDSDEWRARIGAASMEKREAWVYRTYDSAFGQEGSGGWGADGEYQKQYKPQAEKTVRGRVTGVKRHAPLDGMAEGVIMTVRTDAGEAMHVHLGPAWYIYRQDQQIEVGDELEIIGCPMQMQGATVMMARQVTSDEMTLTLRDEEGHPYWSCWRATGARQQAAPG